MPVPQAIEFSQTELAGTAKKSLPSRSLFGQDYPRNGRFAQINNFAITSIPIQVFIDGVATKNSIDDLLAGNLIIVHSGIVSPHDLLKKNPVAADNFSGLLDFHVDSLNYLLSQLSADR